MNISLCITTYNKPFQLEKVLSAIRRMSDLPMEVIVCDDGSTDETRDMLKRVGRAFPVPLRHLWQPDDGWQVSKVRNMGIREAEGDYIVFLDGDCLPHRKYIKDHCDLSEPGYFILGDRAHVKESYTAAFEPTLLQILSGVLLKRLRKRYLAIRNPFERVEEISVEAVSAVELANLAVGCNMAFWKKDIVRINGFNESLKGWALEDIEMAARLLVSGVKAKKVRKKAIIYHLDHGDAVYDGTTILDPTKLVFRNMITWTTSGLEKSDMPQA